MAEIMLLADKGLKIAIVICSIWLRCRGKNEHVEMKNER